MANFVSKYSGAQHDEAVRLAGELDGKVTALTEEIANIEHGDIVETEADSTDERWSMWNARLAFGMTPETAPVPYWVKGQMLVDGTIMTHNNANQQKNRWGFHVLEAYARDNYSRMTMLLDKHNREASGKPSLEYYYYTGANHHATSYGNAKIGSDVAFHSFCFDRDKMTAYGEIDNKMPITLARISLANDIDTTYKTVEAADAAYEPESNYAENVRCLKYIALKNAKNGAMFYDTDRNKAVIKIGGAWHDLPTEIITDASYGILGDAIGDIDWESGVIGGDGINIANTARIRTVSVIPSTVNTISVNSGYEYAIVCLDEDGRTEHVGSGYYDFAGGRGNVVYSRSPVNLADVTNAVGNVYCHYRIIARKVDQTSIDPSEGTNIVFA